MTLIMVVIILMLTDTRYSDITNLSSFGHIGGNENEELWAKSVYGARVGYIYDDSMMMDPQIISIQLFYDDIKLNGTIFGDENPSSTVYTSYTIKESIFHSEFPIRKINLWYNDDDSIGAIQFDNIQLKSEIFGGQDGNVSNLGDMKTVENDVINDAHDFDVGGYIVYTSNKNGINVISGFKFMFVSNDGQFESLLNYRVVMFGVFLFWFLPQIYTFLTMEKRIKPPIPSDSNILTVSAKNSWQTLRETFIKYPHIRRAMVAWFFYSDALGSSQQVSVLFATELLGFSAFEVVLLLLEFEIICAVGCIFHLWLQKKLGWDSRKMLIYHLTIYVIIFTYVLLGLIPGISFGLVNKSEMWIIVFLFAFNAASLYGFGRSLTSNLVPEGKEGDMFSLYAITDKGSSWIGPGIITVVSNAFDSLRWPVVYIVLFFGIAIPIIYNIDMKEGIDQANMSDHELQQQRQKMKKHKKKLKEKQMIKYKKEKDWEFIYVAILFQSILLIVYTVSTDYIPGTINQIPLDEDYGIEPYYFYEMFQDVHSMMFIGFGFLMTFLRRYGFSALGFNFLICAYGIQWGIWLFHTIPTWFGESEYGFRLSSYKLIDGDIATAVVLISFGALLGRANPAQLLVLCFAELILWTINFYICVEILGIIDIGGSILVHTFGAYFGLAVSFIMKPAKNNDENKSIYHSDIFSMIGTLFLWLYWPSFNGYFANREYYFMDRAFINTILSLCGSTVSSFIFTIIVNGKGKYNMVHLQNATLAGGVAIGAAADLYINNGCCIIIGCIAGIISVYGYQYLSDILQNKFQIADTCGVHNLHGLPGILGGIVSAIVLVMSNEDLYIDQDNNDYPFGDNSLSQQATQQILAILVTLCISIFGGLFIGVLMIKGMKSPINEFIDSENFVVPSQDKDYLRGTIRNERKVKREIIRLNDSFKDD